MATRFFSDEQLVRLPTFLAESSLTSASGRPLSYGSRRARMFRNATRPVCDCTQRKPVLRSGVPGWPLAGLVLVNVLVWLTSRLTVYWSPATWISSACQVRGLCVVLGAPCLVC